MKGCNPAATPNDRKRFLLVQEWGCIACRKMGHHGRLCEIHHIRQGDHELTIGLCVWHQRAQIESVWSKTLGPSLATNKRAFVLAYGSETQLLEETNTMLARAGWYSRKVSHGTQAA